MYLVDSSVWLDATRSKPRGPGLRLQQLEAAKADLYLCGPVLQEVLQGARDARALNLLRSKLSVLMYVSPLDPVQSYAEAGRLYARCRWQGVTPRSPMDCLIAQIAIENSFLLLHDDSDFEQIALIEPRLKLA